MRLDSIFSLPASILLLIASHTISAEPSDENESPTRWQGNVDTRNNAQLDGFLRRRVVEEHLRMGKTPVGVMKMSEDEGEKFYMEYWQFDGDSSQSNTQSSSHLRARDDEDILLSNGTMAISFRSPFALHIQNEVDRMDLRARGAAVLALLEKRAFICPVGTLDCSSIGYPNSCCSANENCFKIQDTGLGPVGCCPRGSTCGGTISNCGAPNTPCAANLGGGCCIPNYTCEGVGCIQISTITVTATPTVVPAPTTSSVRPSTTSITSITSSSSTTPPSTSRSPTTTATGVPPVRPTSESMSTPTSGIETLCPTGFYACSAHYDGGCCRVGRNCEKTSCPTTSSTTIISNGLTIAVPIGPAATSAHPTGACATGWTSCAQSDGGNCCPTGFQCGTASCTSLSPSATNVVGKGSPNSGTRMDIGRGGDTAWIVAALLPVFLMVV